MKIVPKRRSPTWRLVLPQKEYVIKQRLAWIKMHERGVPVTQVCLHYGISRKTFYKWLRRYQEGGRDFHVLKDHSRRPHSHPRTVPRATVERLLALWRITHYGPRRLAYYLSQEGYHLSVFGAYRVLQRAGLVKKRRSRPRKKPQSYAMPAPGQRVQVDVKYLPPCVSGTAPSPFSSTSILPLMIVLAFRLLGSAPNSPLKPASFSFTVCFVPFPSPSRRCKLTMVWSLPMSSSRMYKSLTPMIWPCDLKEYAISSFQWPCLNKTARWNALIAPWMRSA